MNSVTDATTGTTRSDENMSKPNLNDDTDITAEGFADQLESEGAGKLAWWLREFQVECSDGVSPKSAANDIYFKVEEGDTDISQLLSSAVIFGVLWEKNGISDIDK